MRWIEEILGQRDGGKSSSAEVRGLGKVRITCRVRKFNRIHVLETVSAANGENIPLNTLSQSQINEINDLVFIAELHDRVDMLQYEAKSLDQQAENARSSARKKFQELQELQIKWGHPLSNYKL